MASEIVEFDITSHIRSRVREVIISSVPDGQVDAMIRSEIQAFFKDKEDRYGKVTNSPFKEIVREEIRALITAEVKGWLDENFKTEWDSVTQSQVMTGEMVKGLIPVIQQKMVSDMIGQALYSFKSQIEASIRGY